MCSSVASRSWTIALRWIVAYCSGLRAKAAAAVRAAGASDASPSDNLKRSSGSAVAGKYASPSRSRSPFDEREVCSNNSSRTSSGMRRAMPLSATRASRRLWPSPHGRWRIRACHGRTYPIVLLKYRHEGGCAPGQCRRHGCLVGARGARVRPRATGGREARPVSCRPQPR